MSKSMNAKSIMKKPKAPAGKPASKADKVPGYMKKAAMTKSGKGC